MCEITSCKLQMFLYFAFCVLGWWFPGFFYECRDSEIKKRNLEIRDSKSRFHADSVAIACILVPYRSWAFFFLVGYPWQREWQKCWNNSAFWADYWYKNIFASQRKRQMGLWEKGHPVLYKVCVNSDVEFASSIGWHTSALGEHSIHTPHPPLHRSIRAAWSSSR